MEKLPEISLEITQKNYPFTFSVKINGEDVSEHICGVEYIIKGGEPPKVRLELYSTLACIKTTALAELVEAKIKDKILAEFWKDKL